MRFKTHTASEFENDGVVAHGGDEIFDEPFGEIELVSRRQEDVDATELETRRVFDGFKLE